MNAATAKIDVIPPAGTDVAEYSVTEAALLELESQLRDATFDVATTAGMKLAKESRFALVKMRTTIEAARKALKEPLLTRGKLIDSEAKRITDRIAALEEPIDAQIKQEERRKEAERQAKERAIAERIAGMVRRIEKVRGIPLMVVNSTSLECRQARDALANEPADTLTTEMDDFHAAEILKARDETVSRLDDMVAAKGRVEAEQAEQARVIAEREAQLQVERERMEAERKALEAQRAAEAEAARLQSEARDRELAELRAAEEKRIAAERAEREAAEREANRIASEKRAADEREAEAARRRLVTVQAAGPELAEALKALLKHYVSLVNSGDAGHWDPETEEVVMQARAALSHAGVVL